MSPGNGPPSGRAAQIMLCIWAAFAAASVALGLERDASLNDSSMILAAVARLVIFLACAASVLIWINRAQRNVRALGATEMMVGPGLAVGWFFIPLGNLVMPYLAMRELWKASTNPRDWQLVPQPIMLPVWWTLWITSNVAEFVAFRLTSEPDAEVVRVGETFAAGADLLSAGAALALAWIIAGVAKRQAAVRIEGVFD